MLMLMLCGDQVYADDVAGPMLAAIHALIHRLGLYGEHLEGAVVSDMAARLTVTLRLTLDSIRTPTSGTENSG
jgi:hypothetical protein